MGLAPAPRLTVFARALLVSAGCALAAGCAADLPKTSLLAPPSIDPNSPVAKEVLAASTRDDPYPVFWRIPGEPRDVRPVRAWSASIYDALRLRRQMIVEAALLPPAPTDTAAFAANQRTGAGPATGAAATTAAPSSASTDAFVEQGRERAKRPSSTR